MKQSHKKVKGAVAERIFARMLVEADLDEFAKRMPGSGGFSGLPGDIMSKLPFFWEVKNQETWSPLAYYRQAAEANPNPGRLRSVVIMTKNNTGYFAFLSVADFLELVYYSLKGGLE